MTKDRPVAIHDLLNWKLRGERIPMITAYDYTSIQIVEAAKIPVVLVGDTLGMVVLGYDTTIPVTLEDMIHHVRAVMRGRSNALVIGDLPFMSYQVSEGQALTSAARLVQEGGCHAVKLEGGGEMGPTVARIVCAGIPVMGHIGYTPQSVNQFGRRRVAGKCADSAEALVRDALALQSAGAFAIVVECVPRALTNYADEVRSRSFPEAKHSTSMDLNVLQHVIERIDARC